MGYSDIEKHIVAFLEELKETKLIKDVVLYLGEFNTETLADVVFRTPAIFYIINGIENTNLNKLQQRQYLISIYLVEQYMRQVMSLESYYSLMEIIRSKLNNSRVPGFGPLQLKSEKIILFVKTKGYVIGRADYYVRELSNE